MRLKPRRGNKLFSILSVFALFALGLIGLTGWQMQQFQGRNLLFDAIRRNDAPAVVALLRAGADPNARAVPHQSTYDIFSHLLNGNHQSREEQTPLLAAVYTHARPQPNMETSTYNPTPNPIILSALLDKGADPNAMDSSDTPPLTFAACSGNVAAVDTLLRHRADLNRASMMGPPLVAVAGQGREEMLRFLLSKGADINAEDYSGDTALIQTVHFARSPAAVRLLLSRHADLNRKDRMGNTALFYALRPIPSLNSLQTRYLPEIITLMKRAGAK